MRKPFPFLRSASSSILLLISLAMLQLACGSSTKKSPQRELGHPPSPDEATVELVWAAPPRAETNANRATLVVDAHGAAVTLLDVDPQMPAHQHGTVTTYQRYTRTSDATPTFVIDGLYFVMPGEWVVNVKITIDGVGRALGFPVVVE